MAIVQEFFYTKVLFGFRILFHFINFGRNVAPWNHKSPWVPKQSQAKRTVLERLPFQISRSITDSFFNWVVHFLDALGCFVWLGLLLFCFCFLFVLFIFSTPILHQMHGWQRPSTTLCASSSLNWLFPLLD